MNLPPLRIGSLQLSSPVVQAALSGYSDQAMRVIARRLGAPYTLCEVLLDKFLVEVRPSKKNQHALGISDEEHPVGGQLMGADPQMFGPAARRLVAAGFDVVDVNFGCPVKKVLGRCRGGFHLSQPEVAVEILRRVRDAVPPEIPVTVKMRRGVDDSIESRDRFYHIFDAAFAIGVSAVTVHGRTVMQRYIGPSNWDFLREVKSYAGQRTVVGSGDLFDAASCLAMLRYTGVDGVSAARGAIGNPWIFRQVLDLAAGRPPYVPGLHEQRHVIAEHFRLSEAIYGSERASRMMRKFGIRYAELHPEPVVVRDAFIRAHCPEEWHAVLAAYYAEDRPGRLPTVPEPNPLCAAG